MAAPRATQFLALRNLTRGSQQLRHLHMTGPATYASPLLTTERPSFNLPRDTAGLRAECKRRNLEATGLKSDLISRLQASELTHSLAFTTTSPSTPPARHFNTSRTLSAVNDASTIDFAYLPTSTFSDPEPDNLRVPIIPTPDANMTFLPNPQSNLNNDDVPVMRAQISSMSADAVFLPMADMSDDHAENVDFHAMADRVAAGIKRKMGGVLPMEEQRAGMMKQIWNDLVDDMLVASSKKRGIV